MSAVLLIARESPADRAWAPVAALIAQEMGDSNAIAEAWEQVERGAWSFWEFNVGGEPIGGLIVCAETDLDGGEVLLIRAAAAEGRRGLSLALRALPAIEQWARESGYSRLRFETGRPGLERLAKGLGYRRRSVLERNFFDE